MGLWLEDLFGGGSEHVIVSGGCEKAFLDQLQLAKSLFWLLLNSGENWCSVSDDGKILQVKNQANVDGVTL